MYVCLLSVFQSHQKSKGHDILALGLIRAILDHNDARFSIFLFLRGAPHMHGPVLKIDPFGLSILIFAIWGPRYTKFWPWGKCRKGGCKGGAEKALFDTS